MRIEKRYLNLTVKHGAEKRRIRLSIDGSIVDEFDIEAADQAPDLHAFIDLGSFIGQEAFLEVVDEVGEAPGFLAGIHQADAIAGAENLYQEPLRPQFHFSSRRGWLNDPNGLVFHNGEYHLFYQHNPYGCRWGNMHWGHAVSPDLLHWSECSIALYPKAYDDWCFSGSAVVDHRNTGGFRTGEEDALVAAYTSTGRGECIAFSNDRGRTWQEPDFNPVVRHEGRDPRLLWHEPTQRWVMAVYDEFEEKRWIAFYTSPDLKTWAFRSRIEGFYECPELLELPIDGNRDRTKWLLHAADGDYVLGDFDGERFTPDSPKLHGDYGNCFYAAQAFSNLPPADGRCVRIAWARADIPGMPFNQMMLFPCELTLRTTGEGLRLFTQPAREIERLVTDRATYQDQTIETGRGLTFRDGSELMDIHADLEPGPSGICGLSLRGAAITYDAAAEELCCEGYSAPLRPVGGRIRLRVLVDRTSLEIFANEGAAQLSIARILEEPPDGIRLFAEGNPARLESLEIRTLKSAWL